MPLVAQADDPWITVHALSEFVFCPRAGVIASENRADDEIDPSDGEQPHLRPRLDYAPANYYELHTIERELSTLTERVRRRLPLCHVIVAVIAVAAMASAPYIGWAALGAIPLAGGAYFLALRERRRIASLVRQRAAALTATPAEPDEMSKQNQSVNWWQLWKAGFESVAYKDALRHEPWRLAGKPWRVLRRGSLRIPVFRKPQSSGTDSRGPRPQDYARIAAYCQLLKEAEGADSPYGIILFGDTYEGIAISNGPGTWNAFCDGIERARHVIGSTEQNAGPPAPTRGNPCKGCRHGEPQIHHRGETEHSRNGHVLPVVTALGVDRRLYHSACGDRFRWIPPHAQAIRKRLGA